MDAKILVVDDEPEMVELISFNLKAHGFNVLVAHDGLEALNQVLRHHPDLVLLDVMLAGMDGFAVCQLLRRQPSTAHIPVILVTALDTQKMRATGTASGAKDYVTKPFSQEDLIQRVKTALITSRAWSEALQGDYERPVKSKGGQSNTK